jgi:hypothetical protein
MLYASFFSDTFFLLFHPPNYDTLFSKGTTVLQGGLTSHFLGMGVML